MNKTQLRQFVFSKDDVFYPMYHTVESEQICKQLQEEYDFGGNILCFMPLKDEVDIRPLFDHIRVCGGRVILPYCVDQSHMILLACDADTVLEEDAMHVPAPKNTTEIAAHQIDLALIPAVALNTFGKRLGRGSGFYDRLIPQLRYDIPIIGICHSWRIVMEIPVEEHDACVTFVTAAKTDKKR